MAILSFCPSCKTMVEYTDLTFKCKKCNAKVDGRRIEDWEWNRKTEEEKQQFLLKTKTPDIVYEPISKNNYKIETKSTVAVFIKAVSIIYLILSIIGSMALADLFGTSISIASMLVSVLFSLLSYGIGEIISLLHSINNKIK